MLHQELSICSCSECVKYNNFQQTVGHTVQAGGPTQSTLSTFGRDGCRVADSYLSGRTQAVGPSKVMGYPVRVSPRTPIQYTARHPAEHQTVRRHRSTKQRSYDYSPDDRYRRRAATQCRYHQKRRCSRHRSNCSEWDTPWDDNYIRDYCPMCLQHPPVHSRPPRVVWVPPPLVDARCPIHSRQCFLPRSTIMGNRSPKRGCAIDLQGVKEKSVNAVASCMDGIQPCVEKIGDTIMKPINAACEFLINVGEQYNLATSRPYECRCQTYPPAAAPVCVLEQDPRAYPHAMSCTHRHHGKYPSMVFRYD